MERPLDVLCVCTHNRTRSVLFGALLHGRLVAGRRAECRTAGFGPPGLPPTPETVTHLERRDLDVSDHRSRRVGRADIARADLIITAERTHVVEIAVEEPGAFARTFTLPELARLARAIEPTTTTSDWLAALAAQRRSPTEYLDGDVPEVTDPTGRSPRVWREVLQSIDDDLAAFSRIDRS